MDSYDLQEIKTEADKLQVAASEHESSVIRLVDAYEKLEEERDKLNETVDELNERVSALEVELAGLDE